MSGDPLLMWIAALLSDHAAAPGGPPDDAADLAQTAQDHGIEPLLQRVLARPDAPPLPSAVKAELHVAAAAAIAHNMLIYRALADLLAALTAHTPVVVLKGVALGPTLYPAAPLRALRDIDLLVPRSSIPAALHSVQTLGYERVPEIAPGINQAIEHHEHLEGGPHQSIALDLHWNLVSGDADWRTPPIDWFWKETEPWRPQGLVWLQPTLDQAAARGRPILQLTPTANLLYLAAHCMLQHGGAQARLIWLYDLHLLLTRCAERIDWRALIERAAEFRWAAAVHAALLATQRCFGTALPADALAALERHADHRTSQFVQRKAAMLPTAVMDEWLKIQAQRPLVRWRMIVRLALPTPGYMRWRYAPASNRRLPLSYLHHWLRIVEAAGRTLAQLARRSLR